MVPRNSRAQVYECTGMLENSELPVQPVRRVNLVIRPNVLTSGSSYVFRLSATDSTSNNEGRRPASIIFLSHTLLVGAVTTLSYVLRLSLFIADAPDLPISSLGMCRQLSARDLCANRLERRDVSDKAFTTKSTLCTFIYGTW